VGFVRGMRQLKCTGDLENKFVQGWVPEVQERVYHREQNGRDFFLAKNAWIVW
jgi:hypothetical protein